MSNPTTPFGWQMPTSTDLVTDLPADFEVFGQEVATDLQYLLGGTTGQVLAKASGTDLDFVWSADAAGMTNPMTTTGDVIYSSSGSTPARLGIGTANQVLAVNSGATAPEWQTPSVGMTLLSTTTLTGSSVTLSSIPQTYKNLQLVVTNFLPADNGRYLGLRINGDSNTRYFYTSANATGNTAFANTEVELSNAASNSTSEGFQLCNLYDYTNTTSWKLFESVSVVNSSATSTNLTHTRNFMVFNQTGAITELNVLNLYSGNFTSGTVLLYGVK
jgi:hypothetical protein